MSFNNSIRRLIYLKNNEKKNNLFVGNEVGVYQSIDGGNTWVNINGNLPDAVFAMDVVISRSNRTLRVATHGNGAYEIDMQQLVSIQEPYDPEYEFELNQNFPNPFNPVTTIQYEVPKQGEVLLQVFDIQGRLVNTLVHGVQSAGLHKVQFDGKNLASGTYLYRLTIDDQVLVNKMHLIK